MTEPLVESRILDKKGKKESEERELSMTKRSTRGEKKRVKRRHKRVEHIIPGNKKKVYR